VPANGTERTNDRTPPATRMAKRLLQILKSFCRGLRQVRLYFHRHTPNGRK